MIGFLDSDILLELAILDFFDEGMQALGLSRRDVRVLPTARFKFFLDKPDKGRKRYGEHTYERLRSFLDEVAVAEGPSSPEAWRALEEIGRVPQIDQGEALLFVAAAYCAEACLLITGDKRSLWALQSMEPSPAWLARLRGKVVCLEHIVLRAIDRYGFSHVCPRFVEAELSNTVLRTAFGSGARTREETAREALEYYLGDLRQTGFLAD